MAFDASKVSYTSISGRRVRESDKAVLFIVHTISGTPLEKKHGAWFPLSRIQKAFYSTMLSEELDSLVLESWLVDKFCEEHGI